MSYMIGTKFYRTNTPSGYPEIIRLKKQIGDNLIFEAGRTTIYLDRPEYVNMIDSGELISYRGRGNNNFYRFTGSVNDKEHRIKMKMLTSPDAYFIKFSVKSYQFSLTEEELKENYTKIIPDGMIVAAVGLYKNNDQQLCKDVIVTLHRSHERSPYAICRQDAVSLVESSNMHIGCTVDIDEIPNIEPYLRAEKLESIKAIAIYQEDNLEDIMIYLSPVKKYDAVLQRLYEYYDKTCFVSGLCRNLYQLLNTTNFYLSFMRMFNIEYCPFELDLKNCSITDESVKTMIHGLFSNSGEQDDNIVYCPYDRSVDLDIINNQYALVRVSYPRPTDSRNDDQGLFVFMFEKRDQ